MLALVVVITLWILGPLQATAHRPWQLGSNTWIIVLPGDSIHCLVQWQGGLSSEGRTLYSFCGVRVVSQSWLASGGVLSAIRVVVPFWLLAVLLAIAPSLWTYQRRRRRRADAGDRCANCGYDLRATPDRCPECGTATAVG
jgi:hypothetical protein